MIRNALIVAVALGSAQLASTAASAAALAPVTILTGSKAVHSAPVETIGFRGHRHGFRGTHFGFSRGFRGSFGFRGGFRSGVFNRR